MLRDRKRHGFGHSEGVQPQDGELARFCVACPQPGVNLAANWRSESKRYVPFSVVYDSTDNYCSWLYRRSITADGFFSAEHMKMKHGDRDIPLSNGKAFMVETKRYMEHLQTGAEKIEVYINILIAIFSVSLTQSSVEVNLSKPSKCQRYNSQSEIALGQDWYWRLRL